MMINEAHISLSGYVATQPSFGTTRTGVPTLNMRVAWTPRRLDRVTGEWSDMSTNFLTVYAYRKLAENAAICVRKGDPVLVRGRVTTRDFEDKNGHQRTVLEVDAISFGHDLTRGVSQFQRVRPPTGMTASEYQDMANGQTETSPDGPARTGESVPPAGDGGAAGGPASDTSGAGEGSGMFNEAAVAELAEDAASAPAPF